jgi:septum formation protein
MLRQLSGRTHRVITGVCLISKEKIEIAAETTEVTMRQISEQEIADYIATGEPMDKAGAYAIQGYAARWIPHIEGCYFNVVGLPLARVASMIDR